MTSNRRIKKEVKFNFQIIRPYHINEEEKYHESIGNIQAFNREGNLAWTAERPTFGFSYYDMQIDEDAGVLGADSGAGRIYKIDLSDGHIISSQLVK